ncbi:hypothetical protein LPUS_02664 [Lasallia pustulata]|uniref:Uncharacterized protein n=1 Tax=Lasallia pustulata TaxID=136370 RepID=A0A1W5CTA0_9LECA|nr:hypothetical protein LPUS_02664 [Lasallia pustulata]
MTSLISSTPRQSPMDPNHQIHFQDAQRKRKPRPVSIFSGASGPAKFRSRPMVVVYYDSAIQDAIEALVRNIGSARNHLRKGKTTASFKARMSSLGMGLRSVPSPIQRNSNFMILGEKMTHPESTSKDASNATARPDPLAAFDLADKHLETAQGLCEAAAHQFLRDGDCNGELEGTRKRFEGCLRVAEQEVAMLRQEEEDETQNGDEEGEEDEEVEKDEDEGKEEEEEQEQKIEPDRPVPKVNRPPRFESSKMGMIEVDDDDDTDSVHIDLSAFRRTRRV